MFQYKLESIVNNKAYPISIRKELAKYLNMLANNVVPPMKRISALIQELRETDGCANLQADGSCPWLLKNAEKEGLRKPRPGDRAYCKRAANKAVKSAFIGCLGYEEKAFDDV
jgi:hypothetical protein